MTLGERLGGFHPFSHLSAAQLEALAGCAHDRPLSAGDVVYRQGEEGQEIYAVESGRIRLERDTRFGPFVVDRPGLGNLFGETGLLDGQRRSFEATADLPARLLVLDPAAVRPLLERDPAFALAFYWALWKTVAGKLRRTNRQLTRFFSETGKPPSADGPPAREDTGQFRIDMASKRSLFQEQKLSSLEINFLSSLSQEKKLGSGEVIFREGQPGDRMYVVLDGRVRISKQIPGSGEEALAFLERGDYFGEMALIDDEPRSADARAHEGGAVVLAISRDVLKGILSIEKVSSIRLLKIFCGLAAKRLREVEEKIVGWYLLSGGQAPAEVTAE